MGQLEMDGLTDAQAAAIGWLSLAFNAIESQLTADLSFVVGAGDIRRFSPFIDRLSFKQKIDHFTKQLQFLEDDITAPLSTELTPEERAWVERDVAHGRELIKRLTAANGFRNTVVHCVAQHCRAGKTVALSTRGITITETPGDISRKAREYVGLAVSVAIVCDQIVNSQ